MREVKKATSHGGFSIRSIFIFAVTTIMVAFLSFTTLNNNANAITTPISDEIQNLQTSQNLKTNTTTTNNTTDKNTVSSGESTATTDENATTDTKPKTSCAIDSIGWLVCPITNFLANGMDYVYEVLSTFLDVQPVKSSPDDTMFRAWSYMRSFANIAFVIAFLIIIYSQMTNLGMSNYGIKKLLPRLIIAAILVNVSYYICAVAVDISNVLGHSVQDVFIAIRENLLNIKNANQTPNWQAVTALVLGGGGALVGTSLVLGAYGIVGTVLLLVPAVLTAVVAVVVALIIMAARQALITILIILSPLAFVAYLLPNTEQWFKKWKSTLMTMLLLFPIFSVIFGGSQLASLAIIQNANSITIVILGLLIQAAPLLITPLLMKFSGSMLAKIGGMVNNPSKGLIDRTKNMSRDKSEIARLRRLSEDPKKFDIGKRGYQAIEKGRRKREFDKKFYGSTADSKYNTYLSNRLQTNKKLVRNDAASQLYAAQEAASKARLEAFHEGIKTGDESYANYTYGQKRNGTNRTVNLSDIAKQSQYATKEVALSAIATQIAKKKQQESVSKDLINNTSPNAIRIDGKDARQYAAGIGGQMGEYSALAAAVSATRDADGKLINERAQLIKHFNPGGSDQLKFITGKDEDGNAINSVDVVKPETGEVFTFNRSDSYMMEAMIEDKLKKSAYGDIKAIMEMSGNELYDYRVTIGNAIPGNGLAAKIPYLGGKTIGDVTQGRINAETLEKAAQNYFFDGRFGPEILAGAEAEAITDIINAANSILSDPAKFAKEKGLEEYQVVEKAQQSLRTLVKDSITILDPNKSAGNGATGLTRGSIKKIITDFSAQVGETNFDPNILK